MPFLEIATALVEKGFSVIPIEPRGKKPLGGFGATRRTRDLAVVAGWASQFPDANVAICADEDTVILETDDWNGLDHTIGLGVGKTLPVTLQACGSSENRPHLFFKRTERATNVGNLVVPGLFEARFNNQYVVGPGSVHPSGAIYRFLNDNRRIEIPDWLVSELARLALSQKNERKNPTFQVGLDGKISEGGRHYALMSFLGRSWTGEQEYDELLQSARGFNEKNCEPPKDEAHVRQCVRDIMKRAPYDPGPPIAEINANPRGPQNPIARPAGDEYIVPGTERLEGWFIKEELNLVVGASGAGKTTVMLQILESIRQGLPVFGHPASQREYRVVMHDRSEKGFARTARRMRLSNEARKRIYRLSRGEQKAPAVVTLDGYLKRLEASGGLPDVLFIEGLDFWAHDDINKASVVENYCSDLVELAQMWNVALVGSVGCPKQKAKDKYQQSRDNINGSAAWGRKVETILFLMLSNPENPNSARKMEVLPRNGPAEIFHLGFEEGRLAEVDDPDLATEKEPLKGVKETRQVLEKRDKQSEIIEYLRTLSVGTEITQEQLAHWTKDNASFERYMTDLSHPVTGWVERVRIEEDERKIRADKKLFKWIVRENQQEKQTKWQSQSN